jgi:hypothetical protein
MTQPSYGLPQSAAPMGTIRSLRTSFGRAPTRDRSPTVAKGAVLRPLRSTTRDWLLRGLPHMASEVAGLDQTGTHYTVEKGDTGEKIATKLVGDKKRWTELKAVNPKIMGRDPKLVQQYGFPIYVGDSVILPQSWVKVPESQVIAAPATVQQPAAVTPIAVSLPAGDIAAQGQARTILAAWGATDGRLSAGVSDYGSPAEIGATSWTARDKLQASSFAGQWNSGGNSPQVIGGDWSDNLAKALNIWAERKATQVAQATPQPTATPTPAPAPIASTPSGVIIPSTGPILLPPDLATIAPIPAPAPASTPAPAPASTPAPAPKPTPAPILSTPTPAPKPPAASSAPTTETPKKSAWPWLVGGVVLLGGAAAVIWGMSADEPKKAHA